MCHFIKENNGELSRRNAEARDRWRIFKTSELRDDKKSELSYREREEGQSEIKDFHDVGE